jgi:hypothetical protein
MLRRFVEFVEKFHRQDGVLDSANPVDELIEGSNLLLR